MNNEDMSFVNRIAKENYEKGKEGGRKETLDEIEKWASQDRFPIVRNKWEEGYNQALQFTLCKIREFKEKKSCN